MKNSFLLVVVFILNISNLNAQRFVQQLSSSSDEKISLVSNSLDEKSVFASGAYTSNTQFGDSTLIHEGSSDIFISKLTSTGEILWVKPWSGSGGIVTQAQTIDGEGGVILSARLSNGIVELNQEEFLAQDSVLSIVVYLNDSGETIKSFVFKSSVFTRINDMTTNNNGELVLLGSFAQNVKYRDSIFTGNSNSATNFIFVLDSAGEILKKRFFNSTTIAFFNALDIDAEGNIFTTGIYQGLILDDDTLVERGSRDETDVVLIKLDSNLNTIWFNTAGSEYRDYANDILVSENGSVFVTGYYSQEIVFDEDSFRNTNSTLQQGFLAKYNSNGEFIKLFEPEGTIQDFVDKIKEDKNSNLVIIGTYIQEAQIGDTTLPKVSSQSAYVAMLDTSFSLISALAVNGTQSNSIGDLAIVDSFIYFVGTIQDSASLSKDFSINSKGGQEDADGYLWKTSFFESLNPVSVRRNTMYRNIKNIEVYPSLFSYGTDFVKLNSNINLTGANYEIVSVNGNIVARGKLNKQVYVGDLKTGNYVIRIVANNEMHYARIVKF
jgi:hypothetical protein